MYHFYCVRQQSERMYNEKSRNLFSEIPATQEVPGGFEPP